MKYGLTVRWLHAGLALTVTIQLACSLFMEVTRPGHPLREPGHALFLIHQCSGLTVACLLAAHWAWMLTGHAANGFGHLFPWFSRARMVSLASDLKTLPKWIRTGFPDQRSETLPLAGAVHGLGLLTASAMAATGATIFFSMASGGAVSPVGMQMEVIHSVVANLMWAYLFAHAGMALYHQLSGSPLISDMFNLVRKEDMRNLRN